MPWGDASHVFSRSRCRANSAQVTSAQSQQSAAHHSCRKKKERSMHAETRKEKYWFGRKSYRPREGKNEEESQRSTSKSNECAAAEVWTNPRIKQEDYFMLIREVDITPSAPVLCIKGPRFFFSLASSSPSHPPPLFLSLCPLSFFRAPFPPLWV
jgi:hypothetical protein